MESLEGGGEFVRVRPRRRRVCVPFETSRLVLPLASGTVAVTASFPPPDLVDPADEVDAYQAPAGPARLDEAAKYFLAPTASSGPSPATPTASATPSTNASAPAAPPPDEDVDASTSLNFDKPISIRQRHS
ncbi:hypothetical protein [Actinosynnema pretiosum]|uniref:hypothetical protein n=1 Tax=Actinosynnema pretiosum TaxID=42197 RepID=UPI001E5E69B1|nr:hypothetical protein [Actinosynnema pretiosum]